MHGDSQRDCDRMTVREIGTYGRSCMTRNAAYSVDTTDRSPLDGNERGPRFSSAGSLESHFEALSRREASVHPLRAHSSPSLRGTVADADSPVRDLIQRLKAELSQPSKHGSSSGSSARMSPAPVPVPRFSEPTTDSPHRAREESVTPFTQSSFEQASSGYSGRQAPEPVEQFRKDERENFFRQNRNSNTDLSLDECQGAVRDAMRSVRRAESNASHQEQRLHSLTKDLQRLVQFFEDEPGSDNRSEAHPQHNQPQQPFPAFGPQRHMSGEVAAPFLTQEPQVIRTQILPEMPAAAFPVLPQADRADPRIRTGRPAVDKNASWSRSTVPPPPQLQNVAPTGPRNDMAYPSYSMDVAADPAMRARPPRVQSAKRPNVTARKSSFTKVLLALAGIGILTAGIGVANMGGVAGVPFPGSAKSDQVLASQKTPVSPSIVTAASVTPNADRLPAKAGKPVTAEDEIAKTPADSFTISRAVVAKIAGVGAVGDLPDVAGHQSLRRDALAGEPMAVFELAERLESGQGVVRDAILSAKLFQKAADQGYPPAQLRVGLQYEKGIGVPRDPVIAREWYRRAAEAGNVRAMHNLGMTFAQGVGGPVDYSAAVLWFRRAAKFGYRDSQYNFAVLAARGLGMKPSLVQAYTNFAAAAAQGDKDAASKRDEIALRLKAEDLTSAKKAAEQWQAQKPDPVANEVPHTSDS